MELECSLPSAQQPTRFFIPCNINPVHTLPYYFCKTHINIILISTSGSFKWPLSHRFPHKNPLSNSLLNPYVPHASPISGSFIWSRKYFAMYINYINPYYAVFSSHLLLAPLSPTYPAQSPQSQTPLAYVFPLKWLIKFSTHIDNRKDYNYVYLIFMSQTVKGKKEDSEPNGTQQSLH